MGRLIDALGRKSGVALLLVGILLCGAGVATAAVSGNFSSSYDGYNDDTATDVRGHEIKVSGTLEFSGENAVNPQITIRSSQHTVLDDKTVQLLQPGGSSVNFNRRNFDGGVRYTADEIPAGTQLELTFVVYPVSGLTKSEIKSAEIAVRYERPDGSTARKVMEVTTSLNNTPPQILNNRQQAQRMDLVIKGLAVIGGITLLLVVVMGLYSIVTSRAGGGDGRRPPN